VLLRDQADGLEHYAQHGGAPGVLAAMVALARVPAIFEPLGGLGAPLVLDGRGAATEVAEVLRLEKAKALSLTPLLAAGGRIGVLAVIHVEAPPGAEGLAVLQIAGGLIGPALALTR
jgi:hypothetical protein